MKNRQRKIGEEEHHPVVKEQLKSYASELEENPARSADAGSILKYSGVMTRKSNCWLAEKTLEEQLNQLVAWRQLLRCSGAANDRHQAERRVDWQRQPGKATTRCTRRFQWEMYHDEALNNAFLEGRNSG